MTSKHFNRARGIQYAYLPVCRVNLEYGTAYCKSSVVNVWATVGEECWPEGKCVCVCVCASRGGHQREVGVSGRGRKEKASCQGGEQTCIRECGVKWEYFGRGSVPHLMHSYNKYLIFISGEKKGRDCSWWGHKAVFCKINYFPSLQTVHHSERATQERSVLHIQFAIQFSFPRVLMHPSLATPPTRWIFITPHPLSHLSFYLYYFSCHNQTCTHSLYAYSCGVSLYLSMYLFFSLSVHLSICQIIYISLHMYFVVCSSVCLLCTMQMIAVNIKKTLIFIWIH